MEKEVVQVRKDVAWLIWRDLMTRVWRVVPEASLAYVNLHSPAASGPAPRSSCHANRL